VALRKIHMVAGGKPIGKDALVRSYPTFDGKRYLMPMYPLDVHGYTDTGAESVRQFEILRFGVRLNDDKSSPSVAGIARSQSHVIKRWIPTYKVHSFPSVEDGAWQVMGNLLIHDGPDDPTEELYGTLGCLEITGSPGGFITFNDHLISLSGAKGATREAKLAEMGSSGGLSIKYLRAERPTLHVL
jgi:hypothetical protein